jgi:parallel beta-helix repeat protein
MKNLITCLVVCMFSGAVAADTWTVDDDGKADFDNIQAAVDAASDGDEIIVMPGTYTSTTDEVVNMLGKAVTLRSSDPSDPDVVASTIIDGENARRGLACYFEESPWYPIISGFTITNGFSHYGGGMYNDLRVAATLTNCTFENNTATEWGGGMYFASDSFPTLTNCTITDNTANHGGGMWCDGASVPILTNCTVCSNTPNQISGSWSDEGGNIVSSLCPGPGACCTNGNCVVSGQENCLAFLGEWQGQDTTCAGNACPVHCAEDINGDGVIDTNDLLSILAAWGACP